MMWYLVSVQHGDTGRTRSELHFRKFALDFCGPSAEWAGLGEKGEKARSRETSSQVSSEQPAQSLVHSRCSINTNMGWGGVKVTPVYWL